MSDETWKCYMCEAGEHPVAFQFCPVSGEHRDDASAPRTLGLPAAWRDKPEAWAKIKEAVDGLDSEGLLALGVTRIDNVGEPTLPVLSPEFREHALATRKRDEIAVRISALPKDESGDLAWELAGPYMNRELPLVRFAVQYCVGDVEDLELTLRMIINEWHGLDSQTGLEQ